MALVVGEEFAEMVHPLQKILQDFPERGPVSRTVSCGTVEFYEFHNIKTLSQIKLGFEKFPIKLYKVNSAFLSNRIHSNFKLFGSKINRASKASVHLIVQIQL